MTRLTKEERVLLERAGIPTDVETLGLAFVWKFDDDCYPNVVLRSTVGSIQTWEMEGDNHLERVVIVPTAPFPAGNFGDITGFYFDVKENRWYAMIPKRRDSNNEREWWRAGTFSFV
jgi:hypothetical protein